MCFYLHLQSSNWFNSYWNHCCFFSLFYLFFRKYTVIKNNYVKLFVLSKIENLGKESVIANKNRKEWRYLLALSASISTTKTLRYDLMSVVSALRHNATSSSCFRRCRALFDLPLDFSIRLLSLSGHWNVL